MKSIISLIVAAFMVASLGLAQEKPAAPQEKKVEPTEMKAPEKTPAKKATKKAKTAKKATKKASKKAAEKKAPEKKD